MIEKIYPHIEDVQPSAPFEDDQPSTSFEQEKYLVHLKRSRLNEFKLEKKKIEDLLEHYKKIKYRWTSADSWIKIAGLTIGGISTVSVCAFAVVGSAGMATPLVTSILTAVFWGISSIDLFLSGTVSIGLTSKKKNIYREICEKLELGINKLYLYQVKALGDGILTNEEIEESMKIVEAVKKEINQLKKHIDKQQVEKNVKKDLIFELKKEYKDNLSTLKS